jgi:hypothetical protein
MDFLCIEVRMLTSIGEYYSVKRKDVFTMSEVPKHEVSFEVFLNELLKEYDYFKNGGTSYRRSTAKLSLLVANRVGEVSPFLDNEITKQIVSKLLPNLDTDKKKDIAKFLYIVAKELHRNANQSFEVKNYIQQKRQNRKPMSFIKNSKIVLEVNNNSAKDGEKS